MYTYEQLLDDVNYLYRKGAEIGHIGASLKGRMIPYIHIGSASGKQLIVQGGIHAREFVTSELIVKMAFDELQLRSDYGVYYVPMTNPDGNYMLQYDPEWKANARGVDINVNFPARWGEGEGNTTTNGAASAIGEYPASEAETIALMDFTQLVSPSATISYHAQGNEIYYYFGQQGTEQTRDYNIAAMLATHTGYNIISDTRGSAGGYKDWCVQELHIPAYTIEIGEGYSYPLTSTLVRQEWLNNRRITDTLYKGIILYG